jgi:tetratricopeptide (TPR) repeat protein
VSSGAAAADGGAAPPAATVASNDEGFWAELADPGLALYRRLLERSKLQLEELLARSGSALAARRPHLGEVIDALELATKVRPAAWEARYWLGVALYHADRSREAVTAFDKARELGGAQAADDIAFKLGVALSKLGEFERAVREYERSLEFSLDDSSRAVVESNCAEALMGMGRLDEAIRRYRRASLLYKGTSLPLWGLGVALDRSDQPSRARQAILGALAVDPGMRELGSDNVFFVPAGDSHYYRAFGLEMMGRHEEAIEEWTRFLTALPQSPWAGRARVHLAELKRLPPSPRTPRRLNLEITHILSRDGGRKAIQLVNAQRRDLERCFARLQPGQRPRLHLRVTYGALQDPKEVEVSPPSPAYGVGACLDRVARRWRLDPRTTLWVSIEVLGPKK